MLEKPKKRLPYLARQQDPTKRPTVGEARWYKNTSAIVGIISAVIGLIITVVATYSRFASPDPVEMNILMLVDASRDGAEHFDGSSKGQATATALDRALQSVARSDNVGLRVFGGDCGAQATRTVEPMDVDNHVQIRDAVKGLRFEGSRALRRGLIEASGDFNDVRRFGGRKKRIVVITSGADACNQADTAAELADRLASVGVRADVVLIGVGVPQSGREQLERIASAAGGTVRYADSGAALTTLVGQAIRLGSALPPQLPTAAAALAVSVPSPKNEPAVLPEPPLAARPALPPPATPAPAEQPVERPAPTVAAQEQPLREYWRGGHGIDDGCAGSRFRTVPAPLVPDVRQFSSAETELEYRAHAAGHLYATYPSLMYRGKMPPLLFGVMITETEIDSQGRVVDVSVRRKPAADCVGAWAVALIRQASPFPAPARMPQGTKYVDAWMIDKSGRFQLQTLTEGQR